MNDQDVTGKAESDADAKRHLASDNDPIQKVAQPQDEAAPPPLMFKRTRDMLHQPNATFSTASATGTAGTGELPFLGSFFLPEGLQNRLNKTMSDQKTGTATSDQSSATPVRVARVCKPPRQSRSSSKSIALSDYTSHLLFMEALNQKHLQDGHKDKK